MKKTEYDRECWKRNEKLRTDILMFHRNFPPVFFRENWQGKPLTKQLKPLLKAVPKEDNFYVGILQKPSDLLLLNTNLVLREGFREILPEDGGETYWKIIGKTPAEWITEFCNLRDKWPMIDKGSLMYGIFQSYRPTVMASGLPFDLEIWKDELVNLSRVVKMVIPVYEDTSSDDIDWKQIANLQDILYGTKQRATPSKYEMKLKVWDAYQEEKDFVRVSRKLKIPRRTVQKIYESVAKDILGFVPQGSMKEKRATGFDPRAHVSQCPQCQKAMSVNEVCNQARVFIDQDVRSLRELTTGKGTIGVYKKTTAKRPTSDEYFEGKGKIMYQKSFKKTYTGE